MVSELLWIRFYIPAEQIPQNNSYCYVDLTFIGEGHRYVSTDLQGRISFCNSRAT